LASEEEWLIGMLCFKMMLGERKTEGCSFKSEIITLRVQVQSWCCGEKLRQDLLFCLSDLLQMLQGNAVTRVSHVIFWDSSFSFQLSEFYHYARQLKISSSPSKMFSPML
jgi:hypothetical protein